MTRKSKDVYFSEIADLVSTRSTCLRNNVGAVIVKDSQILSTGYNGAPKGLPHCEELGGCLRARMNVKSGTHHELCRGLHAEQNAIIQAAYHGVSVKGAKIYCTTQPCSICIKMIINAGITEVVYMEPYQDKLAIELVEQSNLIFRQVEIDRKHSINGN
ncbi:MAG: cytidine/deoxycytidylate deaminase family protein [Candidatus Thorarchaeota archaeon]